MTTIGQAIVQQLEARGVEIVFGIPGVHTVELYRGLASSNIRHVTARHEQGAGFMADGYARISGKPGVAFVITGPGLTNILTPMGQARADSIPILVISAVNKQSSLGRGLGHLHELPDQQAMAAKVALSSQKILNQQDLVPALDSAFEVFARQRGGPVHIEIPTDVFAKPFTNTGNKPASPAPTKPVPDHDIEAISKLLASSKRPLILAGGGARQAETALTSLAEKLDAPVIQTINARGLMHGHPLCVPASASLKAVRQLISKADVTLAFGTELGPTDYDMYQRGGIPELPNLIRIDICREQLARHPATHSVCAKVEDILPLLLNALGPNVKSASGREQARKTRQAAIGELAPDMLKHLHLLETIRNLIPGAILIGDSTQPVYSGNLYYDHDRPGGWFNAASGYGALGYAIPAAIGAALAEPTATVICLTGDGGAQFSLTELMTAVDEKLSILFIVFNNNGYGEIENTMAAAGINVVGCDPSPPDFALIAAACGICYKKCQMTPDALARAISDTDLHNGPTMIEIAANCLTTPELL